MFLMSEKIETHKIMDVHEPTQILITDRAYDVDKILRKEASWFISYVF